MGCERGRGAFAPGRGRQDAGPRRPCGAKARRAAPMGAAGQAAIARIAGNAEAAAAAAVEGG